MASLKSFVELARFHRESNSPIDFVIVYIKEAHASDGWKFDAFQYSLVANHRNINDRLDAIRVMLDLSNINDEPSISIYSDTMTDYTNHLFRAWPERLYVFDEHEILYRSGPGPIAYSIPNLQFFLKKLLLDRQ